MKNFFKKAFGFFLSFFRKRRPKKIPRREDYCLNCRNGLLLVYDYDYDKGCPNCGAAI